MELAVYRIGEIGIAEVEADKLDASNTPEFKNGMAPVVQTNTKVVLDMCRLRFVDSSGLGAILSCFQKLNARGGDMKLCCMSDRVQTVFELARLQRIFDIYSTREDAVAAFES